MDSAQRISLLSLPLLSWFVHIHSKRIAPKTIASYRTSIEQYIVLAIGTVGLRALTPGPPFGEGLRFLELG